MDAVIRLYVAVTSRDEDGQGLTEYALIIALVVLVVFGALALLGPSAAAFFNSAGNSIPNV